MSLFMDISMLEIATNVMLVALVKFFLSFFLISSDAAF